jgi:hypothetical protein
METSVTFPQNYVAYIVLKPLLNTDSDLIELKKCVLGAYDHARINNTKFYFVFNTKHVKFCSPFLIKDFSSWMRNNAETHIRYLIKSYLIISNQIAKISFDAILTFYKPTKPYVVVENLDKANELLIKDATQAGFY